MSATPTGHSLLEPGPGERARHLRSRFFTLLCTLSAVVVLVPLFSIVLYVIKRGLHGVSIAFFTRLPAPVGETGGGMGNAVVGTLVLIAIACAIGLPIGIGAGVYLAEVGRGQLRTVIRFTADVLGGVPSITVGVFVYSLFVIMMQRFSALSLIRSAFGGTCGLPGTLRSHQLVHETVTPAVSPGRSASRADGGYVTSGKVEGAIAIGCCTWTGPPCLTRRTRGRPVSRHGRLPLFRTATTA